MFAIQHVITLHKKYNIIISITIYEHIEAREEEVSGGRKK